MMKMTLEWGGVMLSPLALWPVYGALVMHTRLKPYLDQIGLSIGESGIALDFSMNDFEWRIAA